MNQYINKQVFKAVWPICFGYIPLGVACGILGEKVGLDAFLMAMMSIFLFAGSGQSCHPVFGSRLQLADPAEESIALFFTDV